MDPLVETIGIVAACTSAAVIVKVIADASVRYVAAQRDNAASSNARLIDARLDRMEAAIDAVALEVERVGELQRFADQITVGKPASPGAQAQLPLANPGSTGRVITPH